MPPKDKYTDPELRDQVSRFGETEIKPHALKWEEDGFVPREVLRRMGELGFFGIRYPAEYGGSEMDTLATVCASCPGNNGVSPYPVYPNLAGQKEAYLAYALHQYQGHQRLGAQADIMSGIAARLSADDIKALAAYYASLSP